MPGFDKSGPQGRGPMTGGGRGSCGRPGAGQGQVEDWIPGRGRGVAGAGRGRGARCARGGRMMGGFAGRGMGRGLGRGYMVDQPGEQDVDDLQGQQEQQNQKMNRE